MLTIVDGRFPAAPLQWSRRFIGLAGILAALDAWFALHEAAEGIPIRTFRSLARLDGPAIAVLTLVMLGSSVLVLVPRSHARARVGALVLGLATVGTMVWEQQSYSNHWVLVAAVALLFALVPAPDADGTVPYWPVFLMRLQLTTLYAYTAVAKLNSSYFTGRPLKWGSVSFIDRMTPEKVFVVLSVIVLGIEVFLAFVWIPRLRPWAFFLGIGMHVSIGLFGQGPIELVPFQLAVFAVYAVFTTDPRPVVAATPTPARR